MLGISLVYAYGYDSNKEEITLRIEKGWNLIPAGSQEIQKTDSQIKVSDFKYIFFYDIDDNKYILTMKDGNPTQRDFSLGSWATDTYILHASVWAYSEKEGNLILGWGYPGFNNQLFELSKYNLIKGWNFIFITPNMKSVIFSDLKGDCNIIKICGYEKDNWQCLTSSQFNDSNILADTDSDIGQTLLIKVAEDCNLGGNSISPPQIPN
jgi:hypothetical protein